MAWIEAHDTLPDHPKTIAASTALKIDKDALVGKLWRFWTWALTNRASGFIPSIDMGTVAERMRWTKKPSSLFEGLCAVPDGYEHGFLFPVEGGYMIHDWDVYTNRYMAQENARKKDRERKRNGKVIPSDFHRNSSGNEKEETRNSVSYRNLTITREEEDACACAREDEHGNPLPNPAWQQVANCYLAEIGIMGGGTYAEKLQSYVDDMGADVVCRAITYTNEMHPGHPPTYLMRVLEDWFAKSIRDLLTAEAHLRERGKQREHAQNNHAPDEPPQPHIVDTADYSNAQAIVDRIHGRGGEAP